MNIGSYSEFLAAKQIRFAGQGVTLGCNAMGEHLYPFQRSLVQWALGKGRSCLFADCGLGKTLMQVEWSKHVPGRVLVIAPLAVTEQTRSEAERFGYDLAAQQTDIINYDKLHRVDLSDYAGIVLDESSILKSYDGKFCSRILEETADHRWKLACTATPAPNDHVELGTHAQFVGAMSRPEMLALYFINDGSTSQAWRLKGHARREFWQWVGSWSKMLRHPRDVGFDQDGFDLPPFVVRRHVVDGGGYERDGVLFPGAVQADLNERRRMRRESIEERVGQLCSVVTPDEQWIVWCDLNAESEAATKAIPGAVEVRGSDDPRDKADRMLAFARGDVRVLVTKPSIAGHGMNWQTCARVAFLGMSDSYEAFYQAVRRCWRHGQTRTVEVHVIVSEPELMVVENVLRKEKLHDEMQRAMIQEVQQ